MIYKKINKNYKIVDKIGDFTKSNYKEIGKAINLF